MATERMSLIRKVSADGYKLLTVTRNHALYSDENGRFTLCIRGKTTSIAFEDLKKLSVARSESQDALAIVKDLLSDSLDPLTESDDEMIMARSPSFLSAFAELAEWHTIMPGLLKAAAAATAEETPRGILPAAVFLRQRYPDLRFEVYVDHPSYELRGLLSGNAPTNVVNSTWKAYLRAGTGAPNFNPMVAYGRLCDVLDISAGRPLIASRTFVVERILAPEHFQPTMLPLLALGNGAAFGGIGARAKEILRESSALMNSLLAVSALLASINPMLGIILSSNHRLGNTLQLVCASIGSVCAMLGMIVMALTRVVTLLDQGVAGALGGVLGAHEEVRVTEREITDGTVFAGSGSGLPGDIITWRGWSRLNTGSSAQSSPVGAAPRLNLVANHVNDG